VYRYAEHWCGHAEFVLDAVQRFGDKMLRNGVFDPSKSPDMELHDDRTFLLTMLSIPSLGFALCPSEQPVWMSWYCTGGFLQDQDFVFSVIKSNPAVARLVKQRGLTFWMEAYRLNPKVRVHIPVAFLEQIDQTCLREFLVPHEPTLKGSDDDVYDASPEKVPTGQSRSAAKKNKRMQREKQRQSRLQLLRAQADDD